MLFVDNNHTMFKRLFLLYKKLQFKIARKIIFLIIFGDDKMTYLKK